MDKHGLSHLYAVFRIVGWKNATVREKKSRSSLILEYKEEMEGKYVDSRKEETNEK